MIGFMSNRIEWDEPQPAKRVTLLTTDAATAASTVCCAIDYATPQDLAAAGYVPIPPAPQGEREDDDSPTCEVPGCQYDARYCADHMTVADAENMKEQEMKRIADLMDRAVTHREDKAVLETVRKDVEKLAHEYPIYP